MRRLAPLRVAARRTATFLFFRFSTSLTVTSHRRARHPRCLTQAPDNNLEMSITSIAAACKQLCVCGGARKKAWGKEAGGPCDAALRGAPLASPHHG